jgi:hypothetical protein
LKDQTDQFFGFIAKTVIPQEEQLAKNPLQSVYGTKGINEQINSLYPSLDGGMQRNASYEIRSSDSVEVDGIWNYFSAICEVDSEVQKLFGIGHAQGDVLWSHEHPETVDFYRLYYGVASSLTRTSFYRLARIFCSTPQRMRRITTRSRRIQRTVWRVIIATK